MEFGVETIKDFIGLLENTLSIFALIITLATLLYTTINKNKSRDNNASNQLKRTFQPDIVRLYVDRNGRIHERPSPLLKKSS